MASLTIQLEKDAIAFGCKEAQTRVCRTVTNLVHHNTLLRDAGWNHLFYHDRVAFRHLGICRRAQCVTLRAILDHADEAMPKTIEANEEAK